MDDEIIKKAEQHSKNFFKMPPRVKRQLQADRFQYMKTTRGWTGLRGEQLDVSSEGKLCILLKIIIKAKFPN